MNGEIVQCANQRVPRGGVYARPELCMGVSTRRWEKNRDRVPCLGQWLHHLMLVNH